MKGFIKTFLVVCLVFCTVILPAGAEEKTSLKEAPEITAEFGDYGLTITSENQEYLNSVESIQMSEYIFHSFASEFTKEQWVVNGNELFLPCAEYWKAGLASNQSILIELYLKGYEVSSAYTHSDCSHASELQFYVEGQGDLIIESSDDYWLSQIMNVSDDGAVHVTRSTTLAAKIKNTELVLEDGRIRIPKQILLNHGLKYGETYVFSTSQISTHYYYQKLGEITFSKIREDEMYEDLIYVNDVEVSFTDYGLEVISSDINYLNQVDELRFEGSGYSFSISEGWIVEGGKLFLPCQFYFKKEAKVGTHAAVVVSSKGYFDERRSDYIDFHLAKDVKVFINDQNDIVISSSDDYWLKTMTQRKNESILKVKSDPHHINSWIGNQELIYQDGQVLIPYEVHSNHMRQGITYLLETDTFSPYQNQELGEITITYDLNGVDYDELKRPSYNVSFDDYGMMITSEDSDFLSQIRSVQFIKNEDTVKIQIQWDVSEKELYIPCADILKSGTISENDILLVSAYGYHDTRTSVKVPDFYGKVESVIVDALGSIEIVSYDEYWMERMKATSPDSQLWFIQDSIVYAQIPFEDVDFELNKIIISPSVQIAHDLLSQETYLIKVEPRGYAYQEYKHQPLSEVTITHGRKYLPLDARVVKNEKGQLEISSSDINWLEEIVQNKKETGNSSMTMRKGYGTIYRFENDSEHEDFLWSDGKLVVDQSMMIEKGMTSGYYNCVLDSVSYEKMKFTFKVDQPVIPDDISILVDSDTGEIVIHSNNQNWLKSLTELHDDEYAAVYVEGREEATWFWNDSSTTDLVYQNNQVIISSEAQKRRGLIQGETVLFSFYSTAYGTSDAYEVTIGKGGCKPLTKDISVLQDDEGNLVISSSDEQWLDALHQGRIELTSEELDIWFILYPENMEKQEQIIILNETLLESGMSNAAYTAGLIADDYPNYFVDLTLFKLKQKADFDVQIVFDENQGIIITSEQADYISTIEHIDIIPQQGAISYVYDQQQALLLQDQYLIPIEEMVKDGVNADQYTVSVYSNIYGAQLVQLNLQGSAFDGNEIMRIKGKTRYETSLAIADALKEKLNIEQFDTVILANGRDFADALAGSYLAAKKSAPILMVDSKINNMDQIIDYLNENLKPEGKVYILGGEAAVPEFAEAALNANNISYLRLKGTNRYGTNLAILAEAGVTDQPILVANAKNFADSLSASATGLPLLLVGSSLTNEQKAFLDEHRGNPIYVLGGEAAVSLEVEELLKEYGEVERIKGKTRYETSIEIAKKFYPESNQAILAYAKNYPDGLCGGVLAYVMDAPLILTASENHSAAQQYLNSKLIIRGAVLGGESLISDETVVDLLLKMPILKL